MKMEARYDTDENASLVKPLEHNAPPRTGRLFSHSYWFQVIRWSLVSLLVFELFIRTFILLPPPAVYRPEWGIVPATDSRYMQGWEGYSVTHYLANGEVQTPYNDPGAISIVVEGDSTVQAAQVDNDKNFVSLTESALREKGLRVDLHNLGRSLQSVADHVYIAPAVNAVFSPQIVVVQVNPSNFDLSYFPARDNQFVRGNDGIFHLEHREPAEANRLVWENLLNRSGLYSYLNFRLTVISQNLPSTSARRNSDQTQMLPSDGQGAQPSANQIPPSERYLSQANLLRQAYPNSKIVFLIIPYTPTITWQDGLNISWRSESDDDLTRILAQVDGVYVISARDAFRDLYRKQDAFPRGSFNTAFNYGHLNEAGHAAVAQLLTEALEQILR